MTRHAFRALLALALVGACAGSAGAWGSRGHEVVALIAQHELTDAKADGVQAKVQALLKKHPHYDTYLAKDLPKGVNLDDWVLMRAATWPDWVRMKPEFHRGTWHYVNKPLVFDASKATRLAVEKAFASEKANHGDILTAYPDCRRVVRDMTADGEARAVRLCWIIHLVGDIHQPLHATAYCDKTVPAGDLGGNSAYVRRKPGLNPTNLHTLWDHLLDGGPSADATARDIRMTVTSTAAERKVGDIGAWAEESLDLAKSSAYTFNGQRIDFILKLDQETPSEAPLVPAGYEREAIKVARKRALLAGQRLADVLKADLGN